MKKSIEERAKEYCSFISHPFVSRKTYIEVCNEQRAEDQKNLCEVRCKIMNAIDEIDQFVSKKISKDDYAELVRLIKKSVEYSEWETN